MPDWRPILKQCRGASERLADKLQREGHPLAGEAARVHRARLLLEAYIDELRRTIRSVGRSRRRCSLRDLVRQANELAAEALKAQGLDAAAVSVVTEVPSQLKVSANEQVNANQSAAQDVPRPMIGTHEHLLTLPEAAEQLPSINGKRHTTISLWRWCRMGIHGVRLEYLKIGRNIMTSREALERFYLALAHADPELPPRRAARRYRPRDPAARGRQIEQAKRRLKAAGLMS